MNSHGHVAGSYMQCFVTADEAFYWTPETGRVTLPRPDGVFSARATAINDNGLIVGGHGVSGVGWTGFVYNPNTRAFTYLQPLHPGVTATTVSSVNAINSAGIAVGSRVISKPGVTPAVSNAVIWNTNTGEVIDLGVMGVGPNSGARDINENGDVVGFTGPTNITGFGFFRKANGQITLLDGSWGVSMSILQAVNAHGAAAGGVEQIDPPALLAATWDHNQLSLIPLPRGFTGSGTAGMNDAGQVLIRVVPGQQPALSQHGNVWLVSELTMPTKGVELQHPMAINDAGTILLRGLHDGANVGLVLSPKEQPQGDLNHDCRVDVDDLLILLNEWGKRASPADFNGDGTVDVSDLLILLWNWG